VDSNTFKPTLINNSSKKRHQRRHGEAPLFYNDDDDAIRGKSQVIQTKINSLQLSKERRSKQTHDAVALRFY